MRTQTLLLVFVLIFQFCNVLGRHNFYEYYYSGNHKGHSTTTESILLSTSGNHASFKYEPGYPNDNIIKVDGYSPADSDPSPWTRVIFFFGVLLFISCVYTFFRLLCQFICQYCCKSCTRKEQRTSVNGNQAETGRQALTQQTTATSRKIPENRRVVSGNQAKAAKESQAKAAKESQAKVAKKSQEKAAKENQAKTANESGKNSRVVPQQTPSTSRTFVDENQTKTAKEEEPQQTPAANILMIHQPPEFQQPYTIQRFYEHGQFFPPQYLPHLIQQLPPAQQLHQMQQFPPMQQLRLEQPQFQYSPPAMQSPNPREAPPPYEFPEKF